MKGGSDEADLEALAAGDREAFTALFRRHHGFVYNVAFRRTASWSAAEDVAGTVFLELWRQRERVAPLGGSIRPWLAGVAANHARRVWRGRSRYGGAVRRLTAVDGGDAAGREPDPAADIASRIDDERAMAAILDRLDGLPDHHREVITLWAWEQLSYDEIAVALDLPVGTVRSRLSRARARLRTLAEADGAGTCAPAGEAVDGTRPALRASVCAPPTGVVERSRRSDEGGPA